jgi:nucleotide-binding universal stress UspA family protein
MTTSILVTVDESPWSQSAVACPTIHRATSTARGAAVRLTALHVVSVTRIRGRWVQDLAGLLGFEPVVVPEAVEAHYMERGRRLLAEVEAKAAARGVAVSVVLEQGAVADRLVHHADKADLLVMGSRGETEEQFAGQGGGTAERVLRRVSTTTLVVPRGKSALRGVLLGFDGSDGANLALRATLHLAELCDVPVDVVHVAEQAPTPDPLDEARADLAHARLRSVQRVGGEPREALPAEAVRLDCDTLALGFRGHSQIKDVMIGRTVEWLAGRVDLAILVSR